MPYIAIDRQVEVGPVAKENPANAGELNYQLTVLCLEYLYQHGENYQHMNDVIGALEGCKLEMYRRKVAPYEDVKIAHNGDVY